MSSTMLSVYETADWGTRFAGVVSARHDTTGALFINEVRVVAVDVKGLFSVLSCADGSTRVVLTSFLRLVPGSRADN